MVRGGGQPLRTPSQLRVRPLPRMLPDLLRVPLIRAPTPLAQAAGLAAAIGLAELTVKREDLSGFAMGGNKPRQLEAIVADALAVGADTLITTAAAQSNFCQTTASAAAHLGLNCVLLLRGKADMPVQGNLLLDHVLGAEVEFLDTNDPYDAVIPVRLAAVAERVRARGGRPYIIHLPGRTGVLTAAAAASITVELREQFALLEGPPEALYVAVGSGLTAAGLILGLRHLGLPTRVIGISVQQRTPFLKPLIVERANAAAALLGIDTRICAADFDLDDGFIGAGYGIPSPASLDAIAAAGRHGGLVLDPVYSGKALAGLIEHSRRGRIAKDARAVFVHTGGTASLFAHADAVAEHLAAACHGPQAAIASRTGVA